MKTLVAILAWAGCAGSAFAGECPVDKTQPSKKIEGPSAPANLTDTVISSIDLEAYGSPGKKLRMRKLVIKPGGVVALHGHAARPADTYVVTGQITEYRSTCTTPILHKAGEAIAEQGDITHWWKNNSRRTAVLISTDILPPQ
jgi:quercetin dioxygenase-like cupin family protein